MNHPGATHWPRRRLLASGLSLFSTVLTLGSASLLSGCSDEKSAGQIENAPDPAVVAKDSMNFYKSQHLQKSGKPKPNQ
jgi:hypothetical protein